VRAVRAIPAMPNTLDVEAKAEWRRVTPELHRLGLLSNLDRTILTLYCEWVSTAKKLGARIRKDGTVINGARGKNDKRKHPAWQMYREASAMVATLAKELGLSPNGRARMNGAGDGDDNPSDLD
jgi:P27 family predicted phage terminase small subunit